LPFQAETAAGKPPAYLATDLTSAFGLSDRSVLPRQIRFRAFSERLAYLTAKAENSTSVRATGLLAMAAPSHPRRKRRVQYLPLHAVKRPRHQLARYERVPPREGRVQTCGQCRREPEPLVEVRVTEDDH